MELEFSKQNFEK